MRLFVGFVAELSQPSDSELDRPFDQIFWVNVALFWDDPVAVFRALKDRLTEDGVVAFTYQPRASDKSDAAALAFAGRMEDAMIEGGLGKARIKRLEDRSPIAVYVIGGGSRGEL